MGKQEIERLTSQVGLFLSESDSVVEQVFSAMSNASIRTVGPELIFVKIYDNIGFGALQEDLFRHLVIARLSFPLFPSLRHPKVFQLDENIADEMKI